MLATTCGLLGSDAVNICNGIVESNAVVAEAMVSETRQEHSTTMDEVLLSVLDDGLRKHGNLTAMFHCNAQVELILLVLARMHEGYHRVQEVVCGLAAMHNNEIGEVGPSNPFRLAPPPGFDGFGDAAPDGLDFGGGEGEEALDFSLVKSGFGARFLSDKYDVLIALEPVDTRGALDEHPRHHLMSAEDVVGDLGNEIGNEPILRGWMEDVAVCWLEGDDEALDAGGRPVLQPQMTVGDNPADALLPTLDSLVMVS